MATGQDAHNTAVRESIGDGVVLPLAGFDFQPTQPFGRASPDDPVVFIEIEALDGIVEQAVGVLWVVQVVGEGFGARIELLQPAAGGGNPDQALLIDCQVVNGILGQGIGVGGIVEVFFFHFAGLRIEQIQPVAEGANP